jgi:hypothetical protein
VSIQTVNTTVDGTDGNNDQLFGFRVKSFTGNLRQFQNSFQKVTVSAHRLKNFRDPAEFFLNTVLDLPGFFISAFCIKFY